MSHSKIQAEESMMIDRNQLNSKVMMQTLAIRERARKQQIEVKER